MTTNGDIAVFVTACIIFTALIIQVSYQMGYDAARVECKPAPSYEMKPMTHKQQVMAVKWMNRDRGYIK